MQGSTGRLAAYFATFGAPLPNSGSWQAGFKCFAYRLAQFRLSRSLTLLATSSAFYFL